MSLKRAREYPTKQPFESTDDFAKRLRDTIQEEATDRIQDFDILQLGNVPWVDVREYGAKGDGITDDTAAINAAIDSLRVTQATVKSDQYTYHDCPSAGNVYFPPGHKFLITTPMLMETDHSDTGNRIFADAINLVGYGAEIIADSAFAGVSRYTDDTSTETVLAMLLCGVKSYGKYPAHLQGYNKIMGLIFNGSEVTGNLSAIHLDVVYHTQIKDCTFDTLHKCIDGRVIALPQISNCQAVYANSFYYTDNDSEALGWNSGNGLDSGGPVMDNINVHFSKNNTDSATYNDIGKIHLVNVGEELISNVKILGDNGKGIYKEYDATSKQHYRWGNWSNIQIAGMYYHAVHLKKTQQVNFSNCLFVWNQAQDFDNTDRPLVYLEDVKRINMDNFTIDQEISPTNYNPGQLLHLKGGGCHFSNFKAFGLPHDDDTYECIRVEDGATYAGDDNIFTNFEAGNLYYSSGNKFSVGVRVASGTNNNLFANATIKNCATSSVYLDDAPATNKAINIITDESVDVASAGTITLPDYGEYFNITGTTNITAMTVTWIGRRVVLKFVGILDFTDGNNLKLAGTFTTSADDCIALVSNGTNFYEEGRSAN